MTEQSITQHLTRLNVNHILSDIEEKEKKKGLAEKISTGKLSAVMTRIISP